MNSQTDPALKPKHSWIAIDRAEPVKRPAASRLSDFERVEIPFDESTASAQAARCIQCPVPACVAACPLGTPLAELLRLTAEQQFQQAATLLFETNFIPEIASHICLGGRRCETMCVLSGKTGPVPIRAVTRFLLDYGWKHGIAEPAIEPARLQSVAILGSGICGLVAADALSRRGYKVSVFDSRQNPGGRMMNGLPGFRVDKALVNRRIELLRQRGIRFQMNVRFGDEIRLDALRKEFDAVFLGFGRAEGLPLEIPGATLSGVHQAFPFVSEPLSARGVPDVRGRKVVVLGGGDTAMDAVRMALRRGASEATCVYRRDEDNMPADREEYANALEEGAKFLFRAQPLEVLGDSDGKVIGLRCAAAEWTESETAEHTPVRTVPGSEFEIAANIVLVAFGFTAMSLPRDGDFSRLEVDEHGRVRVDENGMTNLPGVFAGGSIVRTPAPLSAAVRDARDAAANIHRFLQEAR